MVYKPSTTNNSVGGNTERCPPTSIFSGVGYSAFLWFCFHIGNVQTVYLCVLTFYFLQSVNESKRSFSYTKMATGEVTGLTVQELAELKYEYKRSPKYKRTSVPFDCSYCLTRIGKQPEDYDGPTRYCSKRVGRLDNGDHAPSCRFHGLTQTGGNLEDLDKLAAVKHGMYATDEHLKEVFDEDDQKLYDFVMSWADAYGWPSKEEDPARYDLLEQAALNRVRVARSSEYILDEGEMDRQEVYDENGNLRVLTDAHGLSEDLRLKQKLILDIMKELGLTPKSASKMGVEESTASAAEQLAEVAADAVLGSSSGDGGSFDPDDEVFEDE